MPIKNPLRLSHCVGAILHVANEMPSLPLQTTTLLKSSGWKIDKKTKY